MEQLDGTNIFVYRLNLGILIVAKKGATRCTHFLRNYFLRMQEQGMMVKTAGCGSKTPQSMVRLSLPRGFETRKCSIYGLRTRFCFLCTLQSLLASPTKRLFAMLSTHKAEGKAKSFDCDTLAFILFGQVVLFICSQNTGVQCVLNKDHGDWDKRQSCWNSAKRVL